MQDNKSNEIPAAANQVLDFLALEYPEAKTALNYENDFQLLVATILSAQCTDKQVNKITKGLFSKYQAPEEFSGLEQEELEKEIRGCGLYRNKAKNIIAASRKLMQDFHGEVPQIIEELMSLPGVGRKTANVVLANAFEKPAFAVDTHVFRVAHRLGWSAAKDPKETEKDLCKIVPRDKWNKAHHWFIYHGRQVCKARKPMCNKCVLLQLCPRHDNK